MRRAVISILTAVFLLAAVAGCAPAPDDPVDVPDPDDDGPATGGTVVRGFHHDADSLDPHESIALASRQIYSVMYDRLVYMGEDGNPQPWLAESWDVDEDGTLITFQLVEDRQFHDGTPVNAEAVVYTFERMLDPDRASSAAVQFPGVTDVTALDEFTVQFRLEEPYAPFFNSMASAFGAIISPAAAEDKGDGFGRSPVGSGPFMFDSWVPDSEIVFVRNPDYTTIRTDVENQGPPHLDKLVIKIIPEQSTRMSALRTGDIHLTNVAFAQADTIGDEPGITLHEQPAFNLNYVEFNQRKPPFDDKLVRQAVCLAIDVEEIVEITFFGHATPNPVMLPTGVAGHNPEIGERYGYGFDPDRARELLDEAGWVLPDGATVREKDGHFSLEVMMSSWSGTETTLETIQSQLADVGFSVDLVLEEAGTWLARGRDGDQHLNWMRTTWAEPIVLSRSLRQGGTFRNFDLPELDAMLDEAAKEMNWDRREQMIDGINQYVLENAISYPVLSDHDILGIRDSVVGYKRDATGWKILNDVWVRP